MKEKKSSKLLFLIHNKTLMIRIKRHFFSKRVFDNFVDEENYLSRKFFNYKFDCSNPRTFNEYLVWIKLFYKNDLWKKCADKIGSKEFLRSIGLGDYLPSTYGVYHSTKEIDLNSLPNKFVLKTSHDSGSVFICEKGKTNFEEVFNKIDASLLNNYSEKSGEWVYEDILPLVFAEEYLVSNDGLDLKDYKFFMFNGKMEFGYIAKDRFNDVRFALFDKNLNFIKTDYIYLRPRKKDMPIIPTCISEMIYISEKIAQNFDFVRVDLYWTNKGPRIGELTFIPQSGHGSFSNKKYDFLFGKLFDNSIFYELSHKKNSL